MNIKDFRKFIFVNSQSCTYYLDKDSTILAGILRNIGYKYNQKFEESNIIQIEKEYRKNITALNFTFAFEVILFLYLCVFPAYTKVMTFNYFIAILILALIPMVALYITYVIFNKKYEAYLNNNFGKSELVKFQPNIYNVEPSAFERYKKTPRNSTYVIVLMVILFMLYAYTPAIIDNLNAGEKYNSVIKLSNIYLKFVPINADVYAQKGYANYKSNKLEKAFYDYNMANKYSLSNVFDQDILGIKILLTDKNEALKEFDKYINAPEQENYKYFLKSQKAFYLQQNKDFEAALKIYNELVSAYEKEKIDTFPIDTVYFNRGVIRAQIGDYTGANIDKRKAKMMCYECSFEPTLTLVQRP